jgi:hypothetical protein
MGVTRWRRPPKRPVPTACHREAPVPTLPPPLLLPARAFRFSAERECDEA